MFFRLYQHLLPRARAWQITTAKTLRSFFEGLSDFPSDIRDFVDEAWLDIFPQQTRELDAWEAQFGLPDTGLSTQDRRDRLEAAWAAQGGQDPTYIQETLQGAGFSVYVHEWWVPGSEPAVDSAAAATPRDPTAAIVPPAYVLVNRLTEIYRLYLSQFDGGTTHQFGKAESQFGDFDELVIQDVEYEIPTNPATWPYFLYIGGATFPNTANVDADRQEELEQLCLKICPAQQWLGMLINYV